MLGYIALFKTSRWTWRLLAGSASVLFLVPVMYTGMIFLGGIISPIQRRLQHHRYEQKIKAHSWFLKQPTKIADIKLSGGTQVYFDLDFDMQQKDRAELQNIDSLHLSAQTNIFGLSFEDHFYNYYPNWSGTLKSEHTINNWPCFGEITFERDSLSNKIKLRKWNLSTAHKAFGHVLPKGTYIEHTKPFSTYMWFFYLPDGTFMKYDPDSGKMKVSHEGTD